MMKILLLLNIILWLCILISFPVTFLCANATINIVYTYFNVILVSVNITMSTFIFRQFNTVYMVKKLNNRDNNSNTKRIGKKKVCIEIIHVVLTVVIYSFLVFAMVQRVDKFEEFENNLITSLHLLCISIFGLAIYECISFLRNIIANDAFEKVNETTQTSETNNEAIETPKTDIKAVKTSETDSKASQVFVEAVSKCERTSLNYKDRKGGIFSLV